MAYKQIALMVFLMALMEASARPDGGDSPPLPGPGLSYGGIPYGSVSGNVAEYSKQYAPSTGRQLNYNSYSSNGAANYAPIEQWL